MVFGLDKLDVLEGLGNVQVAARASRSRDSISIEVGTAATTASRDTKRTEAEIMLKLVRIQTLWLLESLVSEFPVFKQLHYSELQAIVAAYDGGQEVITSPQ
jgi:hypothetical protein